MMLNQFADDLPERAARNPVISAPASLFVPDRLKTRLCLHGIYVDLDHAQVTHLDRNHLPYFGNSRMNTDRFGIEPRCGKNEWGKLRPLRIRKACVNATFLLSLIRPVHANSLVI